MNQIEIGMLRCFNKYNVLYTVTTLPTGVKRFIITGGDNLTTIKVEHPQVETLQEFLDYLNADCIEYSRDSSDDIDLEDIIETVTRLREIFGSDGLMEFRAIIERRESDLVDLRWIEDVRLRTKAYRYVDYFGLHSLVDLLNDLGVKR